MSVIYSRGFFVVSDQFRKLNSECLDIIYKHNNEKKIAILNNRLHLDEERFLEMEQHIINKLAAAGYERVQQTTYSYISADVPSYHISGSRYFPTGDDPVIKHIVADPCGKEYFSKYDTVTCPKCSEQTTAPSKVLWGQDVKELSKQITPGEKPEIKLDSRDERLLARLRTIIAMLRDIRTSKSSSALSQVLQPPLRDESNDDCMIDELKVIERRLDSATSEVQRRLEGLHYDVYNIAKVKVDQMTGQMDAKDMSITPAINSDVTQSVELINQAPEQVNQDPPDYGVRHAITEQEMDTFEQMANRWFPLKQLVWSTQVNGQELFAENFPSYAFAQEDFITSPNAAIFKNFRFFRFDVEFEIQVNSSKMQCGALLCTWRYLDQFSEIRSLGDASDKFLKTQRPHSFAFCGRNSIAKLHVPYKNFYPVLAASPGETFNINDFFRMDITVFNSLKGGDNCNDPITVNIQMRFVNLKKSGLFNADGIMQGQFDDGTNIHPDSFAYNCTEFHRIYSNRLDKVDLIMERLAFFKKGKLSERFFYLFYASYFPLPVNKSSFVRRVKKEYKKILSSYQDPGYVEHSASFFSALKNLFMDSRNREIVKQRMMTANMYEEISRTSEAIDLAGLELFEDSDFSVPIDIFHGEVNPKTFEDFEMQVIARRQRIQEQERLRLQEQGSLQFPIDQIENDDPMTGQMDSALGIDIQGGLKGAIRGGLEGLLNENNSDSNRDKPSDPRQNPALIPYASHSWAYGDGQEITNILRLQPTGQTPHFQPTDEMMSSFITSIYSGIETFQYKTTDGEGKLLAKYYVHPVVQARSRVITPASEETNQLATYRVPTIGVVASNFAYWKGSIDFRFDFIVPFSNTGRVMIAYIPTHKLNSSLPEIDEGITYRLAKSCYNTMYDLGEETSITFRAPFYTDKAWLKTDPQSLEASGIVAVFVVNRLVRFCNSTSMVDVNTFVRSGSDFQLAVPIKPFLCPSFNRKYIAPTTTYRLASADGPAFASIGDGNVQETDSSGTYGPVIAREGPSQTQFSTIRPLTNITGGDVFAIGESKTIEWTNATGNQFSFKYMVPVITSVGIGDTPPLALFRDQASAREFADHQVRTGSFKGGPYTRYYFVRTPSGQRDQDGPVSNVINGTVLDLVDVEQMTGQMDDRHATSIYSTPGEITKHSSQSFFNESFDDLKTVARRYQFYSNFDSQLVANTCFGKVVARIPVRPIIYPDLDKDQCSSYLFNAVRSGFIPNIGSGFRFFKGSLRFKFIFDVTFMDQSAKQEHDDLTFMITHVPDHGASNKIEVPSEVLATSYNPQGYAYYGHSTRINPICEIEVPYYSRYEYITPYRISERNDLDNLGYIDVALGSRVNKSVNLAIQVYYSFGDDARFSSFQGFPSMVYIGDIPQQPQVAIQRSDALTGQMNGWLEGKIEKTDKLLSKAGQDFSQNLTTALQSSADEFLSHTEVIVEKTMDMLEQKMNKQQDRLEEKVDISTDKIAEKFQATLTESTMHFMENLKVTAEEIVAKSMKQCMEVADEMGLKSMGLNMTEKLVNIVSAVGHIILNPTLKAGILSFVQIIFNLGLILSDKIQSLFSSLINIADQAQKEEANLKGQADDKSKEVINPAMVSSLATVILSAAGLTIGARKDKSIKYASNGLKIFKDFSMASNSFGVWLKNNLSWITSFLQWAHLVDNKMELDNEIVNKYDTLKDWIIETHRILQIPIHRIEADYTMILKVYMLAFRAEEYMAMECSDAGKLPLHYSLRHLSTQICEMRNQLLSSSYSPPIGVEPFVICLSGPPGFGKSELLNRISDRIVDDAGYQCPGNTSYVRGFTEYWNNAGMQPCLIYDDVGTEEESMRQFVKELFSMKSRAVFNPNFAHLEDKRRVFNPIAIIMGTNFPFWDVIPSGANSLEALHRRRDALWQVMPAFPGVPNTMADQFAAMKKKKDAFSESKDQTEFDFSHLKFRLCSNPEAVTLEDAKWHKWVSYDDFYRITLGMFRAHRMKEIKIIKSNLDKAYKKRLNFTDEQESERLRNFFERVLPPNEKTLADLGAFNDPAITAVVGSINVDDLDFGSALDTAFEITSNLNKPDEDEMSGQAEQQKKKGKKINGSEVIEPKDDENTIVDDQRFEQLLATPLKNPYKFPNPSEEKQEEPEILDNEVDPNCPHKVLLDIKVQNVMYTRNSDEDPGVFRYAPDFDNPIPYPKCLKCAFNTKNGKLYLSNWIKECVKVNLKMPDPSTIPKQFATRPCTTRAPPLTKFQEWRNTIVLRTRAFFLESKNKWGKVLKIIGWIALAATLITGAMALYRHYKQPRFMNGNMDPEKALEACKIINKFNESNDIKKLMQTDPEMAKHLSRKMLVESGIMNEEDFNGNSYASSSPGPDHHTYRTSKIKMQRRENKRVYRPLNGQSEQLESIKSMIQTNLGRVFAIFDGKEQMSTMVCGLYNRNAFIMRHQIYTFQKLKKQGIDIKAYIERWIEGKPQKYEFHFDEYVYDPQSDSELVLVTFPKQMPAFKNILRHLAIETTPVTSSCLMTWRDHKGTINNQNIQISRMNYTQSISSDLIVPYQFSFSEALSYNFGGPGLCGSPIITTSTIPKIVGFHCAGQGDKKGSCQRVYQSEFDIQEGQFMCDSNDLCEDKPMIKLPPNLEVVGILKKDKLPGFSTKTQLEKSIMYNEIVESTKMPAPLKKINGIDPMEKALQKLEKVPTGFDLDLLEEAYESLVDDLQFQCPPLLSPEETSVLSLEDCFTGIPGLTEFKKINLATSEGYPLNIMGKIDQNKFFFKNKTAYSGKHWLFDYELDNEGYHLKDIHPLLLTERERMMNQRAAVINGYDLGERQYAVLTLKDQKMDISKALEGKNRIFSCCPVEQSLAVRQYFGHWKAAYMHNRIDNGTAIGIDVNSPEWTQLALELKRHGDHIITGDYTAFGDTLDKDCVRKAFCAINEWYSYHFGDSQTIEYENKMREALYDELIKMPHIAKNVIFVRSNGIPSGFGLTVEINDLVNKLYMKIAWLSLTGAPMREMAQHVYYCMYGDDLIMSVSPKYIDQYNFESIRDFLAMHNITFTPATKDETSYKSLPLKESTFLKANFVEHPSSTPLRPIYLNVLPEASVLELLNWQWKGNDPKQFCFEACRAALDHLYPHGRKKFNSIRKKMLSFFVKNRNTLFGPDDMPDLQTFDELDRRFLSQFLD